MDERQQQLYRSLSEGSVIGPEHHRFRLKGSPDGHPLGQRWQADDISTPRPTSVSLFVINPQLAGQKSFLNEFKQQVIRAKSLQQPHLLTLYGYFVQRGGLLFFTTEAVDGLTLANLMQHKRVGQLKPNQLKGLLLQLAGAIDTLHQKTRLAHAALAPDLVYINRQGGVKLLPLSPRGLLADNSLTLSPAFQYPAFEAPEIGQGEPPTPAADLYSLAAIIHAALNGQTQAARLTKKPSGLSPSQWQILSTALSEDPTLRPAGASEWINRLFATADAPDDELTPERSDQDARRDQDGSGSVTAPSRLSRIGSHLRSRWIKAVLLFTAGVTVGGVINLLFIQQQQQLCQDQQHQWQQQATYWKTTAASQQLQLEALTHELQQLQRTAGSAAGIAPAERDEAITKGNLQAFRDTLADGGYGPDMITLPTGTFRMGDLNGLGDDNEQPVRTITLTRPVALSRFEVTFAEYDTFARATGRQPPDDNGWGRGQQPVVNVSWQDANAYTQWLQQQTGQPYRLPSEAEWEYAARAGTASPYWWGSELLPGFAVCDGCNSQWDGKQPAPVGSSTANPWGFYDLNGNVDEWVADCYQATLEEHPEDGSPASQAGCIHHAMRGGSWFDIGRVIRSASRYRHPADAKRNTWGFRVALDMSANP